MNQEQRPISGLHPQNNRLEIGRAVKRYESDSSGLATDLEGIRQQVAERKKALERAQQDREDLNDVPQLSETSTIKVEDLPINHSDEDLAYFDEEITKREAELAEAQERLKHLEAIQYIKDLISAQEEHIENAKQSFQKAQETQKKLDTFQVDDDLVELINITQAKKDAQRKVDEAQGLVDLLDNEITGLRFILPIFEAGTLTDEAWKQIGEVIRDNPELLKTGLDDIILRFNEKSIDSQKKDIKDLLELRRIQKEGGLDKQQQRNINFEIRAIEISLSKYGVDVRDEENLKAILGQTDEDIPVNTNEEDDAEEDTLDTTEAEAKEKIRQMFIDLDSRVDALEEAIDQENIGAIEAAIVALIEQRDLLAAEIGDNEKDKKDLEAVEEDLRIAREALKRLQQPEEEEDEDESEEDGTPEEDTTSVDEDDDNDADEEGDADTDQEILDQPETENGETRFGRIFGGLRRMFQGKNVKKFVDMFRNPNRRRTVSPVRPETRVDTEEEIDEDTPPVIEPVRRRIDIDVDTDGAPEDVPDFVYDEEDEDDDFEGEPIEIKFDEDEEDDDNFFSPEELNEMIENEERENLIYFLGVLKRLQTNGDARITAINPQLQELMDSVEPMITEAINDEITDELSLYEEGQSQDLVIDDLITFLPTRIDDLKALLEKDTKGEDEEEETIITEDNLNETDFNQFT